MSDAPTAVAVVSGGLDSTVLAYHLRAEGWELRLLSFDYGQRHARELELAAPPGRRHGRPPRRRRPSLGRRPAQRVRAHRRRRSTVPDGHYTDESMRATVVANRNAIFVSLAVGVAVAERAGAVGLGVHAGDHPIYPDCRPEFVASAEHLAVVANEGFTTEGFRLLTPFLHWSKADIVRRGAELGVPFADTWSCYRGDARHCGACGTCVERREAFELAGVADPTDYEPATGAA